MLSPDNISFVWELCNSLQSEVMFVGHLSCKMQDAQLQLMKAICPFQKYPSKQSYAEDTVDHWNNIFLTLHHYIV